MDGACERKGNSKDNVNKNDNNFRQEITRIQNKKQLKINAKQNEEKTQRI